MILLRFIYYTIYSNMTFDGHTLIIQIKAYIDIFYIVF